MLLSPYIRFKSHALKLQWEDGYLDASGNTQQFHPALYIIVLAAALKHYKLTRKPLVITSLYRPGRGSVHNYGRGVDCRTHDIDEPQMGWWERWLKETFIYHGKVGCQTAMIHDTGRGKHLHLQVGSDEKMPEVPETFIQA